MIDSIYKIFLQAKGVSTDTRTIDEGDLFFALKGPNFNGNQYAEAALNKGALAAVVDEKGFCKGEKYLLVEDCQKTLQQLANYHRKQLKIPVIAIAGSNGKTTTKELVKSVLQTNYETFATQGNLNNEIGVPLTLLALKKNTRIAVVEMGARHRYDIQFLCEIAEPTHGIITNTGKDHLETFQTLENTRKTNAELYEYLAKMDGTVFVNINDEDLLKESEIVKNRITYGDQQQANVMGVIESPFPFLSLSYKANNTQIHINSKLTGKYNFENIMAAVAIGKHFKVHDEKIKEAVEKYLPLNNRSQLLKKGSNIFILDAYNANPTSMRKALENLADIQAENKVAILGDMFELGAASYDEHLAMVQYADTLRLNKLILVGEKFCSVKDKVDCIDFTTTEEAKKWFAEQKFEHTTFLLKGSRKMELERLLS